MNFKIMKIQKKILEKLLIKYQIRRYQMLMMKMRKTKIQIHDYLLTRFLLNLQNYNKFEIILIYIFIIKIRKIYII